MIILEAPAARDRDRSEDFQAFAEARIRGQVMVPPAMLPPYERRLHVRQTLREDHQFRVHDRPEGAQAKFDKLAGSPFAFFRGTALLYYRDQAGTDAELPLVFSVGDVHPENFGVMPNEHGAPFFGINDFDEAYFAPFSWDVKRGSTGFYIVAKEQGLSKKKRRRVARAFVRGYLDGLYAFAHDDREKGHAYRLDNSPPMVKALLEAAEQSRRSFLKAIVELDKGRFRPTEEIVPHSGHVGEFQEAIDAYRRDSEIEEGGRAGHFEVKDVAVKKDSGTASLGLDRYFVLIAGPTDDPVDDVILELKQARRSALHGLVPQRDGAAEGEAGRIVAAHDVHVAGGDPYYGQTTIDGQGFLVRERSPYKKKMDVEALDDEGLKIYARICGQTLAQAHARSDEDTGVMEGSAEKQILAAVTPGVFCEDVVRFAEQAAARVYADYELFKKDHALGVFQFVHLDDT